MLFFPSLVLISDPSDPLDSLSPSRHPLPILPFMMWQAKAFISNKFSPFIFSCPLWGKRWLLLLLIQSRVIFFWCFLVLIVRFGRKADCHEWRGKSEVNGRVMWSRVEVKSGSIRWIASAAFDWRKYIIVVLVFIISWRFNMVNWAHLIFIRMIIMFAFY